VFAVFFAEVGVASPVRGPSPPPPTAPQLSSDAAAERLSNRGPIFFLVSYERDDLTKLITFSLSLSPSLSPSPPSLSSSPSRPKSDEKDVKKGE
jgi:hypothetical protein